MAEAFLREYGGSAFEANSAGLTPAPIHPLTYHVMHEVGINLEAEQHRSKDLVAEFFDAQVHVGYLVTVCSKAERECPIYPWAGVRLDWGIDDPVAYGGTPEQRLAKFRETRELVRAHVQDLVARALRSHLL
jgi:arsenate reductase